ncbi:MBL fold metallo-hydrolase [Nocardioides palaemonis]|uniref:MBL fold metallo-hydrolase n=1 Tax=Nocardioides palaemonis TaxID=2829810 RepID=UPI0027DACD96|nr:MBL fold metallo-hydrolase [Nocardioides palaemonis]
MSAPGLRLTVVGCSGSYPGPDSPASSYLLEADHTDAAGQTRTWRILVDLGNGALGQLHRYVDPLAVDAVFVSHLHADHCLDLCGYYVMRKYHPTGPQPRIPVWGPAGTAERMARAYDLPADPGMTEEFDFREHPDPATAVEVGPFRVEAHEVVHPVVAYALRIGANGRTLVYSGDTGPCPALDRVAQGADLLLAEASFESRADNPPDLHLTGSDCGRTAGVAGVGRLVLTHVPPWHDPAVAEAEARATWDGPVELARAGATYDV